MRVKGQEPLSIELYSGGSGACLAVPHGCGLAQGDCLRICGLEIVAERDGRVISLPLPALSEHCRATLQALVDGGGLLPVGEFSAMGLLNCYFVRLEVV